MSERSKNFVSESQQQRWFKYGLNVLLSCLVVIVLGGLVVYIAQKKDKRLDMTSQRVYSLKEQTLNVIRDTKSPITLVSLYSHSDQEPAETDRAQTVADLLDEYSRQGKNINVELIDPVTEPGKVDELISQVTNKYGGEIAQYRKVVQDYPATYDEINKLATGEAAKVADLPLEQMQGNDALQSVVLALVTVQQMPEQLKEVKENVERITKQKLPDWRGATSAIDSGMTAMSELAGPIIASFEKAQNDPKLPASVRQYMTDSLPRYQQIKKVADTMHAQISKLGDLKLDDLRQQLRQRNSILVMGDSDMRTIPEDKVWQEQKDLRQLVMNGAAPKPTFAGEQQITTSILALTRTSKPIIAFVRPGGGPLAGAANPMGGEAGPLSKLGDRLRDYGFEVVEKDLSGQYAMQAQMQGGPPPEEASDAQLKKAIWVVLGYQAQQQNQMGAPPPPSPLGPAVADHIAQGGSALIIPFPESDDFAAALGPLGITVHNNAIAVHEKMQLSENADEIEQAKSVPEVWVLNDYGDSAIGKPIKTLDGVFVPVVPVTIGPAIPASTQSTSQPALAINTEHLLPIPNDVPSWGETDLTSLQQDQTAKFEPEKGDLPPPIYGGAMAEHGDSRVVVIGAPQFAFDRYVAYPDLDIFKRTGQLVTRFPGNGQLFMNSIFWLNRETSMLAISPTSMDTPRLKDMSPATLSFWRGGVLLVLLPGFVIIAGIGVYMARRD
jgi:ABC-type uncharacterized transport system